MSRSQEHVYKAITIFKENGGILRTNQAIRLGIHPETLYKMRDSGILDRLSRGLYRLADLNPLSKPDFVSISKRVPKAVICLISALSFHEITTQVPHEIHLAINKYIRMPEIRYPPVRLYWFDIKSYSSGVETPAVDGEKVRIYNSEKTIADCFKFRNKIGLDIAIEALKLYREHRRLRVDELIKYAKICRVEKVMRPYLEAII